MSNLHLVTGYAGQAHVTAADDGSFNTAIFGSGEYVFDIGSKFAASVVSNNKITIADGDLLMQGRHVRLNEGTTVALTINNGTQGKLRNDLIVARYTKDSVSGVEQVNLVVIQGTAVDSNPADPAYTSGDIINDRDLLNDMPLYRVPLDGLNVGTPVALFSLASIQISDGTVTTAKLANGAVTGDKLASSLVVPIAHGGTGNTEGIAQKVKDSAAQYPINITWAKSGQESTDYLASWAIIDGTPEIGAIAPGKLSVNWANIADTLASTLPIDKGGTGATTPAGAVANQFPTHYTSPQYFATMDDNWSGGWSRLSELKETLGVVSITKLWENASPTSSFESQTLYLDIAPYDFLLIFHYGRVGPNSVTANGYQASIVPIGVDTCLSNTALVGNTADFVYEATRAVLADRANRSVWFARGMYVYTYGASPSNCAKNDNTPNAAIPYQIYGIKGVT